MSSIDFKEIKQKELRTILDIYNYYIKKSTTTFDLIEISLKEFKNRIFINNDVYKTYLIYQNNELLGFCFLTQYRKKPAYDKTAEIGIYLKEQFTHKGFGKIIVEYLENSARINKIEVLIASISGENTSSIKLFEKSGYKKCAHYKRIAEKFGRKQVLIDFQKFL